MAIGIHVAQIVMRPVSSSGVVLDKATATMDQMMDASTEQRVLYDTAIPNTLGYPNVKTYLEREATTDYVVYHLDQTYIVTYDAGGVNSAT